MFDHLSKYIGAAKPPNRLWLVKPNEIEDAETRLGFAFPYQLRRFYNEVGCGFLSQGVEDKKRDPSLINGILGPSEVADLLCDADNPARPYEGFVDGVLPFFDVGENTYLVLLPRSDSPNRVYWPDGKQIIAEDLYEFFKELHRHAGFYRAI